MESKLKNYLGLARRADALVFGIDNIKASRVPMFCIVLSADVSPKLREAVTLLAGTRGIALKALTQTRLDDLIHTKNCKVIALKNADLSKPILNIEE